MSEIYIDVEFLKMKGAVEELTSAIEWEVNSVSMDEGKNAIKLAKEIIKLVKKYYKPK